MDRDSFSNYHPSVNILYFALVIGFSMFFTHPICLALSLLCAFSYSIYLKGKKTLRFNFLMLPMFIVTALLNPAFSHKGATILLYLPNGNPLTLESILYGIYAAFLLICIINWFSCFNLIMTSDKFVYLFGRILPALSLILSMALRFVPRFIEQAKIITNARRCIGQDIHSGSILKRIKCVVKIFSILTTWALENAIDTADSMKNRGYGLPGRTAFSIFSFHKRDKMMLIFLLFCGLYLLFGMGELRFIYYPTISKNEVSPYLLSLFITWSAMTFMPLTINIWEDVKWKAIR